MRKKQKQVSDVKWDDDYERRIIETQIKYLAQEYEWTFKYTVSFLAKRPLTIAAEMLGANKGDLEDYMITQGYVTPKQTGIKAS